METDGPKVGESSLEGGIRLRPFTSVAVIVLGLAFGCGIWLVIFDAESPEERVIASLFAIGLNVAIGIAAFAVIRREEDRPFPLWSRRCLWWSVVAGYALMIVFVLGLFRKPFLPLDRSIWFIAKLIALLPGPMIAWRLLKNEKRG